MKEDMEQWIDPKKVEEKPKKKESWLGFVVLLLFSLFLLFEIVMSQVNLQRLYERKEPYFLLSTQTREQEDKETKMIYRFGLYKIEVVETASQRTTSLKLWFAQDDDVKK